jgi:hypothetical protein
VTCGYRTIANFHFGKSVRNVSAREAIQWDAMVGASNAATNTPLIPGSCYGATFLSAG